VKEVRLPKQIQRKTRANAGTEKRRDGGEGGVGKEKKLRSKVMMAARKTKSHQGEITEDEFSGSSPNPMLETKQKKGGKEERC